MNRCIVLIISTCLSVGCAARRLASARNQTPDSSSSDRLRADGMHHAEVASNVALSQHAWKCIRTTEAVKATIKRDLRDPDWQPLDTCMSDGKRFLVFAVRSKPKFRGDGATFVVNENNEILEFICTSPNHPRGETRIMVNGSASTSKSSRGGEVLLRPPLGE